MRTRLFVFAAVLSSGIAGPGAIALEASVQDDRSVSAEAAIPAVRRYILDVRLDPPAHRISGTARIQVTGAASQPLTFLLNRGLAITSVRDGDQPARFSQGPPRRESRPLRVEPVQGAGSQGTREVVIEYHGSIQPPGPKDPDWVGALVIRTNEVRMTGQTKWFPMLNGQRAPVEASITLPNEFAVIWPGSIAKTAGSNGQAAWRAVCRNAAAPALIAGIYFTTNQPPVDVCFFPESAGEAGAVLRQACDIVAFMESRFGPPPFDRVSICQMRVLNPRFSYNFATPGAVVLPTEIIRMVRRPERKEFWTRKLAHEIAHQWWGCSVDLPLEPWSLGESLAEFSAILYLQSIQPDNSPGDFLATEARHISQFSSLARRGRRPDKRSYRKLLGYEKGPWVLAMLRDVLGVERFDEALHDFYVRYAFQRVTRDDFERSFGMCKALSLETFFKQWIDNPLLPRVSVETLPPAQAGKAVVLRLSQAEPAFVLPVELRLTTTAGAVVTNCLLTRARQEIELPLRDALLFVEVDPKGRLLLESVYDTNALIRTLIRAGSTCDKLLAARRAGQLDVLNACARELRNAFRELSAAVEVDRLRARLAGGRPMNARTQLRLEELVW